MPPADTRAYGALLTAQLLFASLPIAAKIGLVELHFLGFATIRMTGAALVLLALTHLVFRRRRPAAGDLGKLAGLAVFGIVINQVIFLWGLSLTTATNAALLLTLIPVLTYTIALVLGHERFQASRALGIAVALAGVLVLLDPRNLDLSDDLLVGNLMVLVNDVSYALFLVLGKPVMERNDTLAATAWLFTFGTLLTLPVALLTIGPGQLVPPSPWIWLVMIYVILGPSVGTYLLNFFGLSRVPSSTVAAFIYIQPVAAVFLAWLILGEQVTLTHLVAGVLVGLGVGLVTRLAQRIYGRVAPG